MQYLFLNLSDRCPGYPPAIHYKYLINFCTFVHESPADSSLCSTPHSAGYTLKLHYTELIPAKAKPHVIVLSCLTSATTYLHILDKMSVILYFMKFLNTDATIEMAQRHYIVSCWHAQGTWKRHHTNTLCKLTVISCHLASDQTLSCGSLLSHFLNKSSTFESQIARRLSVSRR